MESPYSNKIPDAEKDCKELAVTAAELLGSDPVISEEVKKTLRDLLLQRYQEKYYLLVALANYLRTKNKHIFEADALMKQGHGRESKSMEPLVLSEEDWALLLWFQEVRR